MSTTDTDDFFTYNTVPAEPTPAPKCTCMTHWGEYAQTHCTLDPKVTARNIKMLADS